MIVSDFPSKTACWQLAAGVNQMGWAAKKIELKLRRLFASLLMEVHVIGGKRICALLPSKPITRTTRAWRWGE